MSDKKTPPADHCRGRLMKIGRPGHYSPSDSSPAPQFWPKKAPEEAAEILRNPRPSNAQISAEMPQELKDLPQWVGATADKEPINPHTNRGASVTDPATWGTFEQAGQCGEPHIGFVLTANDPFVVIDLDTYKGNGEVVKLHEVLIKESDSYTESSVSGRGTHIVVKGIWRGANRNAPNCLEVYDRDRFIVMTGNHRGEGIAERQGFLDRLAGYMPVKTPQNAPESRDSGLTDAQVLERARNADNSVKFCALYDAGRWEQGDEYPSQSEADLGLLTILDFYTKDTEQARRLFEASALYRPEKGNGYVLRTLAKARAFNEADKPPEVEVDIASLMKRQKDADKLPPVPPELNNLPHGLGVIQNYIHGRMKYPNRAMAGMAALAALTAAAQANITIDSFEGLGLNEFYMVLAPTGFGKEDLRKAVIRLLNGCDSQLINGKPRIRYSAASSEQAIHMHLQEDFRAQFYLSDEFAEWLAGANKNHFRKEALGYLMRAYTSALSSVSPPDSKSSPYLPVENPRISLLTTSTAERMLEVMDSSQADSGAYNRWVIHVNDSGYTPMVFDGRQYEVPQKVTNLFQWVVGKTCVLSMATGGREHLINQTHTLLDPLRLKDHALAGRLGEQAIKMAGLIALSDRRECIEKDDMESAIRIRVGLYYRIAARIGDEATLSSGSVSGKAYEQVVNAIKRRGFVYVSQLGAFSAQYKKLSVTEQTALIKALTTRGDAVHPTGNPKALADPDAK